MKKLFSVLFSIVILSFLLLFSCVCLGHVPISLIPVEKTDKEVQNPSSSVVPTSDLPKTSA